MHTCECEHTCRHKLYRPNKGKFLTFHFLNQTQPQVRRVNPIPLKAVANCHVATQLPRRASRPLVPLLMPTFLERQLLHEELAQAGGLPSPSLLRSPLPPGTPCCYFPEQVFPAQKRGLREPSRSQLEGHAWKATV